MTKFWTKIKSWFKPKSVKKKPISQQKSALTKPTPQPARTAKPFNAKRCRKLIRKLTREALTTQRARQRRKLYNE